MGKELAGPRAGPSPGGASEGPTSPDDPSGGEPAEAVRLAKDKALRLLGVRPRSRSELVQRLARAGFDPQASAAALDELERVGLVDDDRLARDLATYRLDRRLDGRRAARAAMRARGLSADLVEEAIDEAGGGPDQDERRAEELAAARARRLSAEPPERALPRVVAFLQRRGYPYGVAMRAARRGLALDPDLPAEP